MKQQQQNDLEIFNAALEIAAAEDRAAYLDQVCAGDPALRSKIDSLLVAYEKGSDTLDDITRKTPHDDVGRVGNDHAANSVIGRYKLLQKIGEGGMGVVYMAEQEEPVRRRVALKIIKVGMDTKQVVARFEAERQALAMMDHANIARVLDGGATGTGRPYFVMELVQGVPITEFCDKNRLSAQERIKLFIPVCQAIQSAHQKGIIHRDIKPSNVLVTLHDDVPVPKVIDFGVAKATNQKLTEKTLFTNYATMIGTPAYMSPEQAEMSGLDIDTRSDIYSLGVLLYELLTGTTPFSEQRLRSVAYSEMQRIIVEEEPERPSKVVERLSELKVERGGARAKQTLNSQLKSLSTDLDWIVMKCLEKDRNRRYETANGLASDIQRHLGNDPVWARPPSAAYRFQKAFRRNRAGFAAGAVIGVVLLLGSVLTSWQVARARRAEREQSRERSLAESRLRASLKFVSGICDDLGPTLRETIGTAQADHILTTKCLQLMDSVRQDAATDTEFRFALGRLHLQVAFSQGWWAGNSSADFESSLHSAKEAVQLMKGRSSVSEAQVDLSRAEMVAGYAALGLLRYDEAITHFREMDRWAASAAESSDTPSAGDGRKLRRWASGSIGAALLRRGDIEQALTNYFLPFHRDVLARNISDRSTNFNDLHDLRCSHANLGVAWKKLNRPEKALPHLQESLKLAELVAASHPNRGDTATFLIEARSELGELLLAVDESDEGRALLTNALRLAESLVEREPANTSFALSRISVLRLTASGLASASLAQSRDLAERRAWLDEAELFWDRAQRLIDQLPNVSAPNWIAPDMKATRDRMAAASARLLVPE